jgi:hypothetical protein
LVLELAVVRAARQDLLHLPFLLSIHLLTRRVLRGLPREWIVRVTAQAVGGKLGRPTPGFGDFQSIRPGGSLLQDLVVLLGDRERELVTRAAGELGGLLNDDDIVTYIEVRDSAMPVRLLRLTVLSLLDHAASVVDVALDTTRNLLGIFSRELLPGSTVGEVLGP